MKYKLLILALAISASQIKPIHCQGYLKADGKRIVEANGEEIILRGMGLGGWMLQEGYMLQINNQGMQHVIRARITELIGPENCDRFYDLWLQNHMTRADVDSMARWGFNSIRLPMHYNLFTLPIEDEPAKGRNTWLAKGFALTDSLLEWCRANNLYLILDLHAAPGGQGKDANISDYDETGENSNKWFTDCISLLEKNNIGWAWWPLKKINSAVCPLMIVAPKEYDQLVNYWNKNTEKPSRELAIEVLFTIVENMKTQQCRFNKDVIDAMFRQREDLSTLPYMINRIPGRIYAADFDMGYTGHAYFDTENENTGESGKKAGNKGRYYRNDGVDIGICRDSSGFTNGYNVMSVDDAEWLQFTVTAGSDDAYAILARVANNNNPGGIRLSWNMNSSSEPILIPITGGDQQWKTISLGEVNLAKGNNTLRLIVEKGGFNLNFIEFKRL